MPMMPLVGDEFAGYRLMGVVGRGGMSIVYRAENPRLGSTVALKVLAPEIATDDLFRTRFLQESRIAASLSHPNVIPIYDMGSHADLLYIAMRYVNGHDMRDLMRAKRPLPPTEVLYLVSQCGRALDYAHRHSLIHRDVKPANLLVEAGVDEEDTEHVFLADFGITKHALSRTGLTPTGQFMGTLDYVAPEQIQGKEVGKSADIYSLACVLYEGLTGSVPFVKEIDAAVLWAHVEEDAPPPTSVNSVLPAGIDSVMARALAKDPRDRYPTCHEMVADARASFAHDDQATAPSRPVPVQPPTPTEQPVVLESGPAAEADEPRGQSLGGYQRSNQHHRLEQPEQPDEQLEGKPDEEPAEPEGPGAGAPSGGGGSRIGGLPRRAGLVAAGASLLVLAVLGGVWYGAQQRGQPPDATTTEAKLPVSPAGTGMSGMTDSMPPSASANPLVDAIALANASTGGMLPADRCTLTDRDEVACDHPHLGIDQARFQTYPTLNGLYTAYAQRVRGLSDNRFPVNFGDCTRSKISGEVSWNHNYVHPRHFTVAKVASGTLRDDTQAAGRVFCRLRNGVITIVWTDNHVAMLGTATGAPHSLVFRWWKRVHHDLAVGDMAGMGH